MVFVVIFIIALFGVGWNPKITRLDYVFIILAIIGFSGAMLWSVFIENLRKIHTKHSNILRLKKRLWRRCLYLQGELVFHDP